MYLLINEHKYSTLRELAGDADCPSLIHVLGNLDAQTTSDVQDRAIHNVGQPHVY